MAIYEVIDRPDASRRVLELRSPVTLEPIGELVCANADDVQEALQKARAAQVLWAQKPVKERAAIIQNALSIILDNADDIVETVVRETGKARSDALAMEVYSCADSVAYYTKRAEKFLKPEKPRAHGVMGLGKKVELHFKPLGVVGLITPWNGPVVLALNPAVQALLAGNAVLLKPSEVTPESSAWAVKILHDAGVPADLFQILRGDGQTGAALVEAGVDKISFTGSVNTGRRIAESCARQLIPCTLELGGKDAMIVCADANIEGAVAGAIKGSCMNTGHYCCGTERIYVVEEIYEEFLEQCVEGVKQLRQGSDLGYEEDVGAVFWDRQMMIIEDHVNGALADGAKVHVGGKRNESLKGFYYEPTVMSELTHEMAIMKDETFGPILCIVKVKDEEEAIRLANDSDYGLHGNVWSGDKDKGIEIAKRIDTGGVSVNDMAVGYGVPCAPFGGRKTSGVGQVNGKVGMRGYTYCQPIISDRAGGKKSQSAYPNTADGAEGMRKFMKFLWTNPLGKLFW